MKPGGRDLGSRRHPDGPAHRRISPRHQRPHRRILRSSDMEIIRYDGPRGGRPVLPRRRTRPQKHIVRAGRKRRSGPTLAISAYPAVKNARTPLSMKTPKSFLIGHSWVISLQPGAPQSAGPPTASGKAKEGILMTSMGGRPVSTKPGLHRPPTTSNSTGEQGDVGALKGPCRHHPDPRKATKRGTVGP